MSLLLLSFIVLFHYQQEKYHFSEAAADSTSDFLSGMLEYLPERRKEARALLTHAWLKF